MGELDQLQEAVQDYIAEHIFDAKQRKMIYKKIEDLREKQKNLQSVLQDYLYNLFDNTKDEL